MTNDKKIAIAEAVMAYAVEHYEEGFDWIVECKTINEIVADMDERGYTTKAQIMADYGVVTDVRNDRWADARNSAF